MRTLSLAALLSVAGSFQHATPLRRPHTLRALLEVTDQYGFDTMSGNFTKANAGSNDSVLELHEFLTMLVSISYFRANNVPGTTKASRDVYAPFNQSRDVSLYHSFMPKGTKLDLAESEFCERFDFTMPWGPRVKMCGMVKKGTKKPKVGDIGKFIGDHPSFSTNEFVEVLSKYGKQYTVESLVSGNVETVDGDMLKATN